MTTLPETTTPFVLKFGSEDARLRSLAREIALDILPREVILKNHHISVDDWDRITRLARFGEMLRQERETWGATLNTRERVDVKTLALVEEALPMMYGYLSDARFADNAKVELFKALQRGAGLGQKDMQVATGERVSITINLGNDKTVTVEHQPMVIEGSFEDA